MAKKSAAAKRQQIAMVKVVAAILLIALPFLGFILGMQYQELVFNTEVLPFVAPGQ